MPTTTEETKYIAKIIDKNIEEFLSGHQAGWTKKSLTKDLAEKVGFITINYSVRKSLFDLCRHYNPNWQVPDEVVNRLIKEWYAKKENQTVSIDEFVGLSPAEWDNYVREHSSIY